MERKILYNKIYSKIEELPTLPAVIPRLLDMMGNPKASAADVTKIISQDPAITSKILKVANSAYYGFSQKISQLDRAVPLLGFNMVKSLAVSIGVMDNVPGGGKNINFSEEGLWRHSLAVAVTMREINRITTRIKESEYLFITGLLHDVGKIVLDLFFHEEFRSALEETGKDALVKLHERENETIGLDHCEVASMLLHRWKFPDIIVNPIRYHHENEVPGEVNLNDIAMLRIANSLVQELHPCEEGNIAPNMIREDDKTLLKINDEGMSAIREFVAGVGGEIDSFYNAIT